MSVPRVPWSKTKKKCHGFLSKIIAFQMPSSSVLVSRLVVLNAIRNDPYAGVRFSNQSSIIKAGSYLDRISYVGPQCTGI